MLIHLHLKPEITVIYIGTAISLADIHDVQYSIIAVWSGWPTAIILTPVSTILCDLLCVYVRQREKTWTILTAEIVFPVLAWSKIKSLWLSRCRLLNCHSVGLKVDFTFVTLYGAVQVEWLCGDVVSTKIAEFVFVDDICRLSLRKIKEYDKCC
jgi:hypothetical protein